MLKGLKIVIAGGTGFIGNAIANAWAEDNEVIIQKMVKTNKIIN